MVSNVWICSHQKKMELVMEEAVLLAKNDDGSWVHPEIALAS